MFEPRKDIATETRCQTFAESRVAKRLLINDAQAEIWRCPRCPGDGLWGPRSSRLRFACHGSLWCNVRQNLGGLGGIWLLR